MYFLLLYEAKCQKKDLKEMKKMNEKKTREW